jgi:hypothetical protein
MFKAFLFISGLAKNRTWIWSFGNSYTIHCTTRPYSLCAFSPAELKRADA